MGELDFGTRISWFWSLYDLASIFLIMFYIALDSTVLPQKQLQRKERGGEGNEGRQIVKLCVSEGHCDYAFIFFINGGSVENFSCANGWDAGNYWITQCWYSRAIFFVKNPFLPLSFGSWGCIFMRALEEHLADVWSQPTRLALLLVPAYEIEGDTEFPQLFLYYLKYSEMVQ